jgi:hypothetical protein
VLGGEDGGAGGDPAEDGDDRSLHSRLVDLDGPWLGRILVQEALALQVRELAVDAGRGGQSHRLADLPHGGRIAALAHGLTDELEDPLLPCREVFVHVPLPVGRTLAREADGFKHMFGWGP